MCGDSEVATGGIKRNAVGGASGTISGRFDRKNMGKMTRR